MTVEIVRPPATVKIEIDEQTALNLSSVLGKQIMFSDLWDDLNAALGLDKKDFYNDDAYNKIGMLLRNLNPDDWT